MPGSKPIANRSPSSWCTGDTSSASTANDDFRWLPDRKDRLLPADSLAAREPLAQGTYTDVKEIDPEVWLGDRDAARTLLLTEQVLGQANGFALILLQAELGED